MKRKFAIGLLSVAAAGGAWSCFSQAQDPIAPARASRVQTMRTVNVEGQGEVVNVFGTSPDLSATNLAIIQGEVTTALGGNVANLVEQLKSAQKSEDREPLVAKLKTAVGEQFDARQESKAKELKALEEQLIKLKELHAKRSQQRDQIVSDRVQQIVKEADGLGWGTSDAPDPAYLFSSPASVRAGRGGGSFGVTIPRALGPAAPSSPAFPSPVAPNSVAPAAPAAPPVRY